MLSLVLFPVVASAALLLGGVAGAWHPLPKRLTAGLLAFASGALITAVTVDLVDVAYQDGGIWRTGAGLFLGASVFIICNWQLEKYENRKRATGVAVGFALLASVTLDGVPENLAMGVQLLHGTSYTLLVAIVASNFPEAMVGADKMRQAGLKPWEIVLTWGITGVVLAAAVVIGYVALDGVSETRLSWPLAIAAGAVVASLADTIMPEAYEEGGSFVAYATALGLLLSFVVSTL